MSAAKGAGAPGAAKKKALLGINFAVLLFGAAGLFAKWISLPTSLITFGRVLFSSVSLFAYLSIKAARARRGGAGQEPQGEYAYSPAAPFRLASPRHLVYLFLAGALLAAHWWLFLYSIRISSVAVGTVTFSAFPLFAAFLEPLFLREKLGLGSVVSSLFILLGVGIAASGAALSGSDIAGFAPGLASSLAYALLAIINRRFTEVYPGTTVAFFEQASAALVLLPTVFFIKAAPGFGDIALLVVLGAVITAFAHSLFVSGLARVSARLAGALSSLETVYGIFLSFLLLGESPSGRELIGAATVILAVILAQAWEGRRERAIKAP